MGIWVLLRRLCFRDEVLEQQVEGSSNHFQQQDLDPKKKDYQFEGRVKR